MLVYYIAAVILIGVVLRKLYYELTSPARCPMCGRWMVNGDQEYEGPVPEDCWARHTLCKSCYLLHK